MHNMPNLEADGLQLLKTTLGSPHPSQKQNSEYRFAKIVLFETWTRAKCFFDLQLSSFSDTVLTVALTSWHLMWSSAGTTNPFGELVLKESFLF